MVKEKEKVEEILKLAALKKKEIDELMEKIRDQNTYIQQLEQDADKYHLAFCCGDKKIYINRLVTKEVYDIQKGAILEDIKSGKDEIIEKLNTILNPEPVIKEIIKEVEVIKEVPVEKIVMTGPKASKSTMSDSEEKETIRGYYIDDALTINEIAELMNLTPANINDRIKKYDLKIAYSKEMCQHFVDKGLSVKTICSRFNLTVNELKTRMVKDKLKFNRTP